MKSETATTVPTKVQDVVNSIERSRNTVTVTVDEIVSQYSGIAITFYYVDFNSIEDHSLLRTSGYVSFSTLNGRTKFHGGVIHLWGRSKKIKTYRDVYNVIDTYTAGATT